MNPTERTAEDFYKGQTVYAITGRGGIITGRWDHDKMSERHAFLGVFSTIVEAQERIELIKGLLKRLSSLNN